jgi:hypothetical protein
MEALLWHKGNRIRRTRCPLRKTLETPRAARDNPPTLDFGFMEASMRSYRRVFALALIAAGFCLAQSAAVHAGCVGLNGTADGVNKSTAVARSQNALASAIQEYKALKGIRSVSISPMRPKPQPYWRSSVSPDLYQKPDIVTSKAHTICWSGVVSPTVCSSGARICW